MTNTANMATSSPVAWRFLARSCRSRSPSSPPGRAADHERATLSPDGADDCAARRPVRVSSALIEPVLIVGARDAWRDRPQVGGPRDQKWPSPPYVPRPRSSGCPPLRSGGSASGLDEAPPPADRPVGGGEHRVGQDPDHEDDDHESKQGFRLRELPGELEPGADGRPVGHDDEQLAGHEAAPGERPPLLEATDEGRQGGGQDDEAEQPEAASPEHPPRAQHEGWDVVDAGDEAVGDRRRGAEDDDEQDRPLPQFEQQDGEGEPHD